jgi:hypothetical protein
VNLIDFCDPECLNVRAGRRPGLKIRLLVVVVLVGVVLLRGM